MIIFICSLLGLGLFAGLFMQQPSFGQSPQNARLLRIKNSKNFKSGSFQNQIPTPVMADGVGFFTMIREFMRSHPHTKPIDTIPSFPLNASPLLANATEVVWLGHSSYLILCEGKKILVDPVFSAYASPVQFAGVKSFAGSQTFTIADVPAIDVIILTHDHYDHLDYNTIIGLKDRVGQFVMPLGVGQHLERWGVDTSKIHELDWWESYQINETLCLTATPARHFSGRGTSKNKTLWASFVLQTANYQIFMSGDSGYGPHFKEIGARFGSFDLALIESGQFNDFWPNIHLHPQQSVQAAIDLNTKIMLPIHWAKFKLAMHEWNGPIQKIVSIAKSTSIQVSTPKIGEHLVLGKEVPHSEWFKTIE